MYVGTDTAVVVDVTAPAVVVVAVAIVVAAAVVVAEAVADAAEVAPLADTCSQHTSNVCQTPVKHLLSPDAETAKSQQE